MIGGEGDDYLLGEEGNDYYIFAKGDGHDTIYDDAADSINGNILDFQNIHSNQLWFDQDETDLVISIIGTNDQVTIQSWFLDENTRQFTLKAADNSYIVAEQIQQLIIAMAAFTSNENGSSLMPEQMQQFNNTHTYWSY